MYECGRLIVSTRAVNSLTLLLYYYYCRIIQNFVNDHSVVKSHLSRYVSITDSTIFKSIPSLVNTRFAEYLPNQTEAILSNYKILLEAIPDLQDHPYLGTKAKDVLAIISSPEFLAKTLLVTNLYKKVSELEKKAQNIKFGMFDYIDNCHSLKQALQKSEEIPDNVTKILEENEFQYKFNHMGEEMHVEIPLIDTIVKLNLGLRSQSNKSDVIKNYKMWIDSIEEKVDDYLQIPKYMVEASSALSVEVTDIEENIQSFINFASRVNLNFKQCQEKCRLTKCACFKKDVGIFLKSFHEDYTSGTKGFINRSSNENVTHMAVLANYLKEGASKKFSTNIYRVLELLQLIKPTHHRFESKYSIKDISDVDDMVNIEVFLRLNSNMIQIDLNTAREYFLKANHQDALQIEKHVTVQSKTVKKVLENLEKKKKRRLLSTSVTKVTSLEKVKRKIKKMKITDYLKTNTNKASYPTNYGNVKEKPNPVADCEDFEIKNVSEDYVGT